MSCVFQGHRMIDFFPYPYSFNAMLKPVSWSCGHSGCLVCLRQLHSKSEMPYGSEGISGINYFCQHCPWPRYKQTCCGVPKSNAPSCMCKRGMRIPWGSGKNAAAQKILQQEGDPLCGDLIVWDSSREHEQFQCINATRPCPLGCGKIFPR